MLQPGQWAGAADGVKRSGHPRARPGVSEDERGEELQHLPPSRSKEGDRGGPWRRSPSLGTLLHARCPMGEGVWDPRAGSALRECGSRAGSTIRTSNLVDALLFRLLPGPGKELFSYKLGNRGSQRHIRQIPSKP